MDFNDPIALRDLAEQKEKEWKDLAEKRSVSFVKFQYLTDIYVYFGDCIEVSLLR